LSTNDQPPPTPSSQPGSDDDTPASSQPSPAADAATTPSQDGAPADSTSSPDDAASSSPDANADAPASSPASDPKPDGDDCAQISTYTHAQLTADVKLSVQIPYPPDQAAQLPHKLTLANDDSSYSKTLTLASDCQAGPTGDTSVVTFDALTEHHTYTLQCDDGTTTYSLFENVSYEDIAGQAGGSDGSDASDPSQASSASASGPTPDADAPQGAS
jgi:hypothetical protein